MKLHHTQVEILQWMQRHFGAVLVNLPWAPTVNRCEWHRVEHKKQKGFRLFGTWWLLYGPQVSM